MNIETIKDYMKFRGMVWPEDGKDALDFVVTEVGEAMDAWIRKFRPRYVRNNEKETNIGWELADAYQMLRIACYLLTGKDLDENLIEKWKNKGYDIYYQTIYDKPSADQIFQAKAKEQTYKGVLGDSTADWWKDRNKKASVKVPRNLSETVPELDEMLKDEFLSISFEDVAKYHHTLGRWIRNNWGLWDENSQLYNYFKGWGLWHADDMSNIILENYWCLKHKKPYDIANKILFYQTYWEKEKNHLETEVKKQKTIFGFPVAEIKQSKENEWWNDLTDEQKKLVREECQDYFVY